MRSRVSLPKLALKLVLSVSLPALDMVEINQTNLANAQESRMRQNSSLLASSAKDKQHQEKRVYLVLFWSLLLRKLFTVRRVNNDAR